MKASNQQKFKRNGNESLSSEDDEVAGLTMNSENEKLHQRYNKKKSKSIKTK